MATIVNGNEIALTGTVGDLYWDDSFTHSDVIMALAEVGRDTDIIVRINSGGGIATEGSAIHSALAAHKGEVTIIIEGIAASAASVIAMAGDEVVMSLGSLMMIHDPSGFTFGTVTDHEMQIKALDALGTAMAGIYADKTGKTADEARADMREEIWLTPEEAVSAGYANRIVGVPNDDHPPEPTAFDFRLYQHPPERLVALADQHAWTKRTRPVAAHTAPSTPVKPKERSMTTAPAGAPAPANHQAQLEEAVKSALTTASATSVSRADASQIVTLCVDGGVPAMAASLLAEGVSVDDAKSRIGAAGQIKDLVALARRANKEIPETFAATMIAEGKTVEQARAALFDKLVAKQDETEIRSHVSLPIGESSHVQATSSMQRELERSGLVKKGA